ncbi:MAG: diguanylate cyclase [Syntrophales bacterium]|nr:diguanylate cyclase [Syntrophales bacterium]
MKTTKPLRQTISSTISLLLLYLLFCTPTSGNCTAESNLQNAPPKLIAAIPADLSPTYFLDKSGKPDGFAVDVMNELARRTGLTVEYVSGQAFDDVIQMVLTGKADLIPSLTIDEQRKELLAFTDTVGFLPVNLIVASGNHTVQGISPGLTIGVMKGSAPENLLKKNQTIRIETFTNLQTMLFELLAGHVDGIVFLTPNLMKLAIDAGVDDKIKVVGKPIIEAKRGIALRKEDTELLTRLNKAIGEFIDSPEYQQVYVKWYGKPKPYWTAGRIGAVSGIFLVLIISGMAFWRYRSVVRLNNSLTLNISVREQAEEALRESETKLQAIFDTVGTGIIIIERDTQIIIEANKTAMEMTGLPQERIIGHICHSVVCPAQAGKCPVKDLGQSVDNSERKLLHSDGHLKDILKTVYPITIKGRDCYLESFIDISKRKHAEEELRRNKEVADRLAQEIAIVAEIGKVIGSTLDTEEVYERFAAETKKLILFDSLTINLYKFQENALYVAYVSGVDIDGRRQGDPLVFEGSLSEAVIRARTSLRIQPASIDEIVGRFPRLTPIFQAGLRSIMCVPLVYRDEVIGVLHFRSKKPSAYTEQDLRLAERIGEQIVGTIANAQLYAGLKKTEQELKESEQRYRELSIVDDLTQLYNSRHFYVQLKIELDRSNRYEQPLTLLLLDLDDFKVFNDAYGHVEGDQVLRRLGQVVKRCLRETDFAYRYGGEEFTILLPMTTCADGAVTAERIRTEFKKERFSPAPGRDVHVTVSIGLAQYKPQEEMKAFVHRVDQLMYQGKKNGKDRVCSESSPQEPFEG